MVQKYKAETNEGISGTLIKSGLNLGALEGGTRPSLFPLGSSAANKYGILTNKIAFTVWPCKKSEESVTHGNLCLIHKTFEFAEQNETLCR